MSAMFWRNNYSPSVQIDHLLNQKDITLNKLMDAEDIIQECKGLNKRLIEYLTRDDIFEELVNLIIEEPSSDVEERWRYKYANVACELLTCGVLVLGEKLAGNEALLSKLYSFIDKDEPLNPLLASFFSKTLHALLRRASDQNWFSYQCVCLQVLESLKSRKNCVDLLLQHIQTSAIMDLILILVTKIEGDEMRLDILKWLDDQQLVQRLVKLLSSSSDPEKHENASLVLCDIRESEPTEKRPDPILQTLQSEETTRLILDTILSGEKLESSIVGGVRILINLLGQSKSKNTENNETLGDLSFNIVEDAERQKFALVIICYLEKFNQLLLDPPQKPPVKTTAGFLEKPFGRSRLIILKLYVRLLSTENPIVFQKFAELDTLNLLLNLFFEFAWNNFLHTEVQQCVSIVINCDCPEANEIMYPHIFVKSKLINRLLDAWENNDNASNKQNGIRQGYMGHLIIMSNDIVKRCETNENLLNYLKSNLDEETMQKWENFVSTTLSEINAKQEQTLGDPPQGSFISPSDMNNDYSSYPQHSYEQDMGTNYQEHYMQNALDQLNQQQFNPSDDDYEKRREMFNKICDEKKFEIMSDTEWEHDNEFPMDKTDWLREKGHNNSSSSDEDDEEDPRDLCLPSDNINAWESVQSLSVSDTSSINLWNCPMPEPVEQTGWANFADFNSAFGNDINFENTTCNEAIAPLPEVPSTDENILPKSETGSNSDRTQDNDIVNKIVDTELKTEETSETSISSSDSTQIPVNMSDTNANLTAEENRTSEPDDNKTSEDSPSNISQDNSEILTNTETVTSATNNVSPITADVTEPPK